MNQLRKLAEKWRNDAIDIRDHGGCREAELHEELADELDRALDAVEAEPSCECAAQLDSLRAHAEWCPKTEATATHCEGCRSSFPLGVLNAEDSEAFQQLLNAPAQVLPALAKAMRGRRKRMTSAAFPVGSRIRCEGERLTATVTEVLGAARRVQFHDDMAFGILLAEEIELAPDEDDARQPGPCSSLIRDGQTTIGACELERGHGGEHMRGSATPNLCPAGAGPFDNVHVCALPYAHDGDCEFTRVRKGAK